MSKPLNIIDNLLTINPYSRWGRPIKGVKALVIHWVANPMTSAVMNRDFFESRKDGKNGYGSAHYIIDLNGDVIRCIPESESAFHCGSSQIDPDSGKIYTDLAREKFGQYAVDFVNQSPNSVTLSIELTHTDWNGRMNTETYDSLVQLSAQICKQYTLDPENDILTHKAIVGWKSCPKWFIDNPTEWEEFKQEVKKLLV